MRKYGVPYLMTYDEFTRYIEIEENSKERARGIAVELLSTDQDVKYIGSVDYVVDLGVVRR